MTGSPGHHTALSGFRNTKIPPSKVVLQRLSQNSTVRQADPQLTAVGKSEVCSAPKGRHQHGIDELARMERICLELSEESKVPGEAGALLEIDRKLPSASPLKGHGQYRRSLATEAKNPSNFSAVDRISIPL